MTTCPSAPGASYDDSGMATAEMALAVPALLAVLAAALWAVCCVGAQLRCVDAARAAARLAARSESVADVQEAASAIAPTGARVAVAQTPESVTVTVRLVVRPLGAALSRLPGLSVGASATALREDLP